VKKMYSNEKILEAITRITEIANKSRFGINSKLQMVLDIIVSCIQTGSGSIMLLKGKHNLEVAASTNKDIIGVKQPLDDISRSTWAVKNKKTLFSDDSENNLFFSNNYDRYKKESFLIAPIFSKNKVIGVISITEKIGPDRFLPEEKEWFLAIAAHVISTIENHRLNESLQKKQKNLREKNVLLKKHEKLKAELFHMLIHDLKGPIAVVTANLDILSYTVKGDDLEYVREAMDGCNSLYEMISDIMDISRIEEGKLKLILETINPSDLIKDSVSRIHGLIQGKELTIVEKHGSMEGCLISGDRAILLRVLQNLFTNAIRFSPYGETIEVGFQDMDYDSVRFYVKDNGPGVPDEYQNMIFDKYFQLSNKKEKGTYSTGLGLTFCKLAVESHGGNISVLSDGENGSCFTFTIKKN
jgi:K+-sensing histidine kinase KdpD